MHLFPILVKTKDRDDVILKLNQKKIGVAVNFRSLTNLSLYNYKSCPNSEKWGNQCISLPFHLNLKKGEIKYVSTQLKEIIRN